MEIWYFRLACLAIFLIILIVFLVRLGRWMSFQSKPQFLEASIEISQHDKERKAASK